MDEFCQFYRNAIKGFGIDEYPNLETSDGGQYLMKSTPESYQNLISIIFTEEEQVIIFFEITLEGELHVLNCKKGSRWNFFKKWDDNL